MLSGFTSASEKLSIVCAKSNACRPSWTNVPSQPRCPPVSIVSSAIAIYISSKASRRLRRSSLIRSFVSPASISPVTPEAFTRLTGRTRTCIFESRIAWATRRCSSFPFAMIASNASSIDLRYFLAMPLSNFIGKNHRDTEAQRKEFIRSLCLHVSVVH